jgi:hypothetical protein
MFAPPSLGVFTGKRRSCHVVVGVTKPSEAAMRVEEAEKARTRAADPEPHSAEWWQERSATELREIIKHGFRLGSAYDGAIAETERRAREATRRMRDRALADSRKRARVRAAVLAAAFVVFAIALAWLWISPRQFG